MADSWLGRTLELEIGAVAHGGHCVARSGPTGRVVFVRHTLPGERVRAVVTEDAGGSFCRADAVEVLAAAPGRVAPPCPYAGAGRCGGCDWQHVSHQRQRELKGAVVAEQLHRLAGIDAPVLVEELPGGPLGWRTRMQYALTPDGRVGLRRHRSRTIEILPRCLIGVAGVGDAGELAERWPAAAELDIAAGDRAQRTVSTRARQRGRHARPGAASIQSGPARLSHQVGGIGFTVSASGFWQVHPEMAGWLVDAVLGQLQPRPGERALDLYAGAGLFTVVLAGAVGQTGTVLGVESDRSAVSDAAGNLAAAEWARVQRGVVSAESVAAAGEFDVVVLDPPRTGAGAEVIRAVLGSGARAVSYVACDPAALARDLRTAAEFGWRLDELRAVDAFPMTHHVECVALLRPR